MTIGRAVKVRAARQGDEGAIAEAHMRAWQAAYRGQLPDEFLAGLSVDHQTEMWRAIIAGSEPPTSGAFVLEQNGRVAGFAHAAPSRDDDATHAIGELTAIYVIPELWRSGGGRLLIEHALTNLDAAGFAEATLWVLDTNVHARQFYEALGWTPDGATKVDHRQKFALHEMRYRRTLRGPPDPSQLE